MTPNAGKVDIAVQGPGHSLDLYWATDGVPGWHLQRVAGAGTTYSAPSLTNSAGAIVPAARPGGSLDFYWQLFGAATWNPEQVAPSGSVG